MALMKELVRIGCANKTLASTTGSIFSSQPSFVADSLRESLLLQRASRSSNLSVKYESGSVTLFRRQWIAAATTTFLTFSMASEGQANASEQPADKSSPTSTTRNVETVFVAGATGNTGKRIVKELLSTGYRVRAGVRDIAKAKTALPNSDNIEFVLADVTEGPQKLALAIKGVDAVICATGFRPSITDPLASWKVDNLGTVSLVDACKEAGVKRFVLVSSILVNGAAIGQILNPAYIILNVIGLTLIAKLQAENYMRQSGIDYTIVRPGGLKNDPPSGNVVIAPEDTLFEGSISRDSVAQVAVSSLLYPEASYKVVEIVARPDAPAKSLQELFASV